MNFRAAKVNVLLVLTLVVFLLGCSQNDRTEGLVSPVTTPAAGYPLALRVRDRLAPTGFLTLVLVVWAYDHDSGELQPQKIKYGFNTMQPNQGLLEVTIDNVKRVVSSGTNPPAGLTGSLLVSQSPPLPLSCKGSWEILDIAKRNGLLDLCSLVSRLGGEQTIFFMLDCPNNIPTWHVRANGWNKKGPIAKLEMDIDGDSGAMLKHTYSRSQ